MHVGMVDSGKFARFAAFDRQPPKEELAPPLGLEL